MSSNRLVNDERTTKPRKKNRYTIAIDSSVHLLATRKNRSEYVIGLASCVLIHGSSVAYQSLERGEMMRKQSLVEQFGKLPEGMSKADVEAVLQFLYGAFDRRTAKQIRIVHPYVDVDDSAITPPDLTVFEFCRWLEAAAA
jgi:hypothetical protein